MLPINKTLKCITAIAAITFSLFLFSGCSQESASNDSEITQNVQSAIAADPSLAGHSITVTVTNGQVNLVGTVDNKNQEQAAVKIAQGVTGVKGVQSTLIVRPAGAVTTPTTPTGATTMPTGGANTPMGGATAPTGAETMPATMPSGAATPATPATGAATTTTTSPQTSTSVTTPNTTPGTPATPGNPPTPSMNPAGTAAPATNMNTNAPAPTGAPNNNMNTPTSPGAHNMETMPGMNPPVIEAAQSQTTSQSSH